MRNFKANICALGGALRQSNDWNNARAVAARTFGRIQLAKSAEEDRAIVLDLLKQHLAEASSEQHSVVDNLEYMLTLRHGAAVLGKHPEEQIMKDLDARCNATSSVVKVATRDELYGPNGTFVNAMRVSNNANGRHHIYFVGEGPEYKAAWVEDLNTVLDDNKVFCQENGERIPLGRNVRVIFFWEHVKDVSPATVARLAFVA